MPGPATTLMSALAGLDQVRATLGLSEWADELGSSVARGRASGAALLAASISTRGSHCSFTIGQSLDGVELWRARSDHGDHPQVEVVGEWSTIAEDPEEIRRLQTAAANNDLESLLSQPSIDDIDVVLTLVSAPEAEYTWVRTAAKAVDLLSGDGALAISNDIVKMPSLEDRTAVVRRGRLVVLDAGAAELSAEGVVIHGPDRWPDDAPNPTLLPGEVERRRRLATDDPRQGCPSPTWLHPSARSTPGLAEVERALGVLAGLLAWIWLADRVDLAETGDPIVEFDGAKRIAGPLPQPGWEQTQDCVDLWAWVNEARQPSRWAAVTQAVGIHADSSERLADAAKPILESARFLFEATQRDLVGAAVASRRSAREAARGAARAAADRSSGSARSAVDRCLVVLGGGVGIVLASKGELVDDAVAIGLIVLAACLAVGAGVMAFAVDLRQADGVLADFESDLAEESEALSAGDRSQVRDMQVLASARLSVDRAKKVIEVLLVLTLLVLVVLGVLIVAISDPSPTNGPL